MAGLFVKKDLVRIVSDANDPNAGEKVHGHHGGGTLKRTLGPLNLTLFGVGAIVGAGIFTITGTAAAQYAGPGIIYSFLMAGCLCAFAGLCYSEMAAMIPVAGSAYAYSYATMGELIAWIIGWDLVLEYAFGAILVANSWSGYLYSLLHKTLGLNFPQWAIRFTRGPWETVVLCHGDHVQGICQGPEVHGVLNVPAILVALAVAAVLYRGIKESATVNNLIVFTKVAIVLAFIALGLGLVSRANLMANPASTGLGALVPPHEWVSQGARAVGRYGWGLEGVIRGSAVVFIAYIGFDAVSTTAQEARNPKRDMPIGILGSLVICTVLYILVAFTLTGVVPFKQLGVSDPIALGIDRIVALRGWDPEMQRLLAFCVKFGALAGLTSVILVIMLGQSRVFYAMSKDGLLPWFGTVHATFRTPYVATVITGIFVAVCGGLLPIHIVGELCSIGTLLAFVLVCLGVPILRVTTPQVERPFRVPWPWLIGPLGAASCVFVMTGLPVDTWLRLLLWMEVGLVIYSTYGWRKSRLAPEGGNGPRERIHKVLLTVALAALVPTLAVAVRVFGR